MVLSLVLNRIKNTYRAKRCFSILVVPCWEYWYNWISAFSLHQCCFTISGMSQWAGTGSKVSQTFVKSRSMDVTTNSIHMGLCLAWILTLKTFLYFLANITCLHIFKCRYRYRFNLCSAYCIHTFCIEHILILKFKKKCSPNATTWSEQLKKRRILHCLNIAFWEIIKTKA